MSKAFTREDDLPDLPVATPARIPDAVRYVTPEGMKALSDELASLDRSSRRAQVLAATLPMLVVQAPLGDGTVGFGCWVTVRDEAGAESVWRIVGPDEADARSRKLSVASPMARALLGKRAGDTATVELPRGQAEFEIVGVATELSKPGDAEAAQRG
ncbi:MAG TPA: GreA/GreB family elongation factor [Myxococcales bacterium]|nr:GreA/GreB family elongation factor [Myxococcales bacterium]